VRKSFLGLAGAGAAVGIALADQDRRHRLQRQARVWRLTAKRGVHFAAIKVRGARASQEQRARLEEQFAVKTAEDVAALLGNMKGAIMKAGQMLSFIADGLPPEAQAALATLQADVPPMAPSLAEGVVRSELGQDPERVFLDWNPVPVAAASIGQVHKAVLPDGRIVAVKIQYPGVDKAIKSDLDNAELLYGMFASFALKNMDVKGMVDELRSRMYDELDYTLEARLQGEFAALYRDHPFVHIPDVVPELSTRRVLVSEWVDGMTWTEFLEQASPETKQKSAEVLFRFAEGSIWRHGVFNGDPHPGNYRFHADGSVTFLDFGLVKRWSPGELEELSRILDRVIERDAQGTCDAMVAAKFLAADHGLDPEAVWHYVSRPWEPFTVPEFTYTRPWVAETIATMLDLKGEHGDVIRHLNMPSSYVILDRVVWGVSALLGRIRATNRWRAMLAEYRQGDPPTTELGRMEEEWRRSRPQPSSGSSDFAIR
jgi:predicted unusual protein kinase regulating ubiquinone biosynthesis (AarF/ABC1/UbiB family)